MLPLPSPDGDHGSTSEILPSAERTPRAENRAEQNSSHEQKLSRSRPCDACRRRKSRCVLNEGAVKCVLCEFHAQDCTFIEEIPPRKRRRTSCEDEVDRWLPTYGRMDSWLIIVPQILSGYCAQKTLGKKRIFQVPRYRRGGLCRSQGTDSFETNVRSSAPTS